MPRKPKVYHVLYKTTCLATNRYYIGMHSTNDLNDGYLGSGTRLRYSIKKYGVENHKFEIIEQLPDRSSLKLREKEIVNKELINDTNCMNIGLGGGGGLLNEEHAKKFHAAGGKKVFQLLGKRHLEKLKNDLEYRKKYSEKMSKTQSGEKNGFYGRKHSEETKEKMRLAKRRKNGEKIQK